MKKVMIAALILAVLLAPLSLAQEYYLPGEEPQQDADAGTDGSGTETSGDDGYVPPTPAEEKMIVRQNYFDIKELQEEAIDLCRKKEHAPAIEKLDSAFRLADELDYINQGYNRLDSLAKVWLLCAGYQEEDGKAQYVRGAGRAVETAMVKAEQYIQAHKIRAAQMFLFLARSWEKMRYNARDLDTKYTTEYTCQMELYCLERSAELGHPQAEATINKLESSGECEGFSAAEPEEIMPVRTEEEQAEIERLIAPENETIPEAAGQPETQMPEKEEEIPPEAPEAGGPEPAADEKGVESESPGKTLFLALLMSVFAIIVIVSAIMIGVKKKSKR